MTTFLFFVIRISPAIPRVSLDCLFNSLIIFSVENFENLPSIIICRACFMPRENWCWMVRFPPPVGDFNSQKTPLIKKSALFRGPLGTISISHSKWLQSISAADSSSGLGPDRRLTGIVTLNFCLPLHDMLKLYQHFYMRTSIFYSISTIMSSYLFALVSLGSSISVKKTPKFQAGVAKSTLAWRQSYKNI